MPAGVSDASAASIRHDTINDARFADVNDKAASKIIQMPAG
jgi:hypothetical protein